MGTFTPLILFWYIYPVIVLFGCQFLVKLFSLNRRFKIKAPDLAIPFLWGGMHAFMHCLEIQGQFLSYRFSLFLFC